MKYGAPVIGIVCAQLACLGGCVIETERGSQLSVSWVLESGPEGAPVPCPDALATVQIVSVNETTGERFIDLFDCVDGGGLTDRVSDGAYRVYAEVFDSRDVLRARSFERRTLLREPDTVVPLDYDISLDQGFLALSWTIDGDEARSGCDVLGTDGVRVSASMLGEPGVYATAFSCADGAGLSSPLPISGAYSVVVELWDGRQSIAVSGERTIRFGFGNELVDLGNFDFTTY